MLYKMSEFNVDTLIVRKNKDATYIQSNNTPFELQQIGLHGRSILYQQINLSLMMLNQLTSQYR